MNESQLSGIEIVDIIANIIIALFALGFSIYIFHQSKYKDKKGLKLDWYKTIIIETSITKLFDFFSEVDSQMERLVDEPFDLELRKELNENILSQLRIVRLQFVDLLLAMDKLLNTCVRYQLDEFVDGLTIKLFNESLDLSDKNTFDSEITNHISIHKTKILRLLVEFEA